jgi:4-aminobutyrate aminotransferase-like enzyme
VQGEGGFIPMAEDFPRRLKELCDEHGILYVDDEVQAGVGRTGPVWAIEHYGVEPDLLVSGKSLGGGLPLAGVTGKAELMDAVPPGGLGGTFGGNPLACAAAIAVLNEVRTAEFRARAEELGARIAARLDALDRRRGARSSARCWRSSSRRNRRSARRASRLQRESAGSCCSRAACTGT